MCGNKELGWIELSLSKALKKEKGGREKERKEAQTRMKQRATRCEWDRRKNQRGEKEA